MYKLLVRLAAVGVVGSLIAGCGANPFGPGFSGGLGLFAKIAQAVQKPAAINKEETGKDGAKSVVNEGTATAKRLAKSLAGGAYEPGVVAKGLLWRGDTLVYYEDVLDKPSNEDPIDKKATGHAEVGIRYTGARITDINLVDTTKITDIYFWSFLGREQTSKWNGTEVCSLKALVTFGSTTLADIKPGNTYLWGMNISERLDMGRDDTTSFVLDSLDDANHIQYGEGHFLDAHTGDDNTEGPRPFDYTIQIIHKNTQDPSKPYLRYQDNEGIVEFALAWGKSGIDSLHLNIHFYPNYRRTGTIKDDNGVVRVEFDRNEKTNEGWTKYYNDKGEEISG